jgi:hypothetical protein
MWHGCNRCFDAKKLCLNGKTAQENYENTQQRMALIRTIIPQIIEKWECEIREDIRKDKDMRQFFNSIIDTGRLDPRHAFSGGRVGPLSLLYNASEGEKISYLDVVSLYPHTLYSTSFPVGMPELIDFKNKSVKWRSSADNPYLGLIKCQVLPPHNLIIPVLPLKVGGRLCFPLCLKCSREKQNLCSIPQAEYECNHRPEERSFVITTTSMELNEALDNGYVVTHLFKVWQYHSWDDNLFKPYICDFFTMKIMAQGWPKTLKNQAEREDYIQECRKMGFPVKYEEMSDEVNPGLRALAKLCLNSLWGKFAMRNNLNSIRLIKNPHEYYQLVYDHRHEIMDATAVSENIMRVTYRMQEEFIEEHESSNVVIALWTTSAARIYLFKQMKKIATTPGCHLLYTDTDSVIFAHPTNVIPVKVGHLLGQLSDEYPDYKILEFASAGNKQYGLRMIHEETMQEKFVLKIRGITLDQQTCRKLHYDVFREDIIKNYGVHSVQLDYHRISVDKFSRVVTSHQTKTYRAIYEKGIITQDLRVLPFGYAEQEDKSE